MNFFSLSKELCEKGVMSDKKDFLRNLMISGPPNSERKAIWLQLTGASSRILDNVGYYQKLLKTNSSIETISTLQIDKDLGRTFATESFFINKSNVKRLQNVLVAYSFRNETIGYCQGLNFITARLLGQGYSDEESFWILAQILEQYMPFDYYTDMTGLILDMKVLDRLISKHLPKVHRKLAYLNLEPVLFAVQWFVCIFSYNLPSQLVIRVWDIFFIEGITFIFKLSLAILHIFRKAIIKINDFNEGIAYCGNMASNVHDIDLLLETTERFNIDFAEVQRLRQELSQVTQDLIKFERFCSSDSECKKLQQLTSFYFTFLTNAKLNIDDSHFDEEVAVKQFRVGNATLVEDRLMVAVKNHYCSKENQKECLTKFLAKETHRYGKIKIVMPKISLSPFFILSDTADIVEVESKPE